MKKLIKLTPDNIDLYAAHKFLEDPECGGICAFTGTVRARSRDKKVERLFFEAYESMALKKMEAIARDVEQRWAIHKLAMIHVTGDKSVGEAVVFTGASAAHREEAFRAARYLIDALKKQVPIWKKEIYGDDSIWVNARP